jgi:hypothetical protein
MAFEVFDFKVLETPNARRPLHPPRRDPASYHSSLIHCVQGNRAKDGLSAVREFWDNQTVLTQSATR